MKSHQDLLQAVEGMKRELDSAHWWQSSPIRFAYWAFRTTLGKTVRGHGLYPRYDLPFLRALRDLGWATSDQLGIERERRHRGWFPASERIASIWLESARQRRLVERNADNDTEWGTTERGESRVASRSFYAQLPLLALLVAAGTFVATIAGVEAETAVGIVVGALFVLLYIVFVWPLLVGFWRTLLAAFVVRLEKAMIDESDCNSIELAGLIELLEGWPTSLNDDTLDKATNAISGIVKRLAAD